MCYSAMIWANYRRYVRRFGAGADIQDFFYTYWVRAEAGKVRTPKAMDDAFRDPQGDDERNIKVLIEQFAAAEATRLEQEIFAQRARLVTAERTLAVKVTKAAAESKRIATSKVERALERLADLRRTEPQEEDSRIYPGYFAPVMVMEAGRLVVRPMRYQCRLAGKPPYHDARFPGTYNARRESLEGYWRSVFGRRHGIIVATSFFENVSLHAVEHRELGSDEKPQNVVLHFKAQDEREMLLACVWDVWQAPGEPDLLSFAAITDEPPPEVAAAGHDRCVIPIDPANMEAWLTPEGRSNADLYAILDRRERPYYEHRIAA